MALVGTRGNGKTQMAVELMKDATANRRPARFTTAVGFFMQIKSTYRKDATRGEADVITEFLLPSLLVVDEFEKRAETAWENNLLFELLNRRYNQMKDTVLIANEEKKAFVEYVGESVSSRMNEVGGIVECTWPSFRK